MAKFMLIIKYFSFSLLRTLKAKNIMRNLEKGHEGKEKAFYFVALKDTFFLLFEQGALRFYFVPCPTNYMVGPVLMVRHLKFN